MEKPVFDLNKALGMVDGDKKFLKELVELFEKDYAEKIEKISSAIPLYRKRIPKLLMRLPIV